MSIKTIQKRIKQVMMGTVLSGAMMFTPMSGCDLVAEGNPAAKNQVYNRAYVGLDKNYGPSTGSSYQGERRNKGIIRNKGALRGRGIIIK